MKIRILILAGIFLVAASAAEATRTRNQYATSQQPYWRVGTLNQALSMACRRHEFGQRLHHRRTIGFVGGQGQAVTGIATNTWNLYDPTGLAQPRTTYHFFNQGYSDCKVYTAPTPRRQTQ